MTTVRQHSLLLIVVPNSARLSSVPFDRRVAKSLHKRSPLSHVAFTFVLVLYYFRYSISMHERIIILLVSYFNIQKKKQQNSLHKLEYIVL